MALIESEFEPPPDGLNVRAVRAGDADEMVTRLTNEVAAAVAAGEEGIADFNLAGSGSGPEWEAWFVTGDAEPLEADFVENQPRFVAAVAGNPDEALFYLKQRLAAAIGATASTVFKVEVAGAGDGPTYMAVAMFGVTAPAQG
jgi:hypothetical protein